MNTILPIYYNWHICWIAFCWYVQIACQWMDLSVTLRHSAAGWMAVAEGRHPRDKPERDLFCWARACRVWESDVIKWLKWCLHYLEYPGVQHDHDQAGDVEGSEGWVEDEVRVVEHANYRLWVLKRPRCTQIAGQSRVVLERVCTCNIVQIKCFYWKLQTIQRYLPGGRSIQYKPFWYITQARYNLRTLRPMKFCDNQFATFGSSKLDQNDWLDYSNNAATWILVRGTRFIASTNFIHSNISLAMKVELFDKE